MDILIEFVTAHKTITGGIEEIMKSPPDLDKYLGEKKCRYITYQDGARQYSMAYWTFVKIAKEAKANIKLRKTALVDQEKLDKYLEEYYSEEDKRKEKQEMPKNRTTTNDIKELVKSGKKKYVRYAEGAELYSMGKHTFQELAKDANAIRKVKRIVLVNTEILDAFIESFDERGC